MKSLSSRRWFANFFCLFLCYQWTRYAAAGEDLWYKTVSFLLFTIENHGGQRSKIVSPKVLLIFRHFVLNIEQTYEIIHVSYTTFPKHLMRNVISFSSENSAEICYHFVQLKQIYFMSHGNWSHLLSENFRKMPSWLCNRGTGVSAPKVLPSNFG